MLELRDVGYRYPRAMSPVFAHVSATVSPGHPCAVRGGNGAGKSTLLRIIAGFTRPSSGTVAYAGRTSARRGYGELVAYSAGAPLGFYPRLSGMENLRLIAGVRGERTDAAHARTQLERVGLGDAAGVRYLHYSLGMRQRLHLASVCASDAPIWVLDEPTNGLDAEGVALAADLLGAAEGRIVVFVSHDRGFVDAVAHGTVTLGQT